MDMHNPSKDFFMKKLVILLLPLIFLFSQFSYAKDDVGLSLKAKLDEVAINMDKNQHISQSWQLMIDVYHIIEKHPEYNDGAIAEGIDMALSMLLQKPWKFANPYFTDKRNKDFFQFVGDHLSGVPTIKELEIIEKNISQGCDLKKTPSCKKLIVKVNETIAQLSKEK